MKQKLYSMIQIAGLAALLSGLPCGAEDAVVPGESDSLAEARESAIVPARLRLFPPSSFDSLLALVPSRDSLRAATRVVSIGIDTLTGSMTVISLDDGGEVIKTVIHATAIEGSWAGSRQAAEQAVASRPDAVRQDGRTWLIIETAAKSAYVYGSGFATAFPSANEGVVAGLSLLTIGGALYGTYAFTEEMELGYGKVGLMNYGSSMLGITYPSLAELFLHNATSIDDAAERRNDARSRAGSSDDEELPSQTIRAWSGMAGFPLGIWLGSRWGVVGKDDYGRLALMQYFSQFGGFLLGFTLPLYFSDQLNDADYLATSSLLTMGLIPAGFYLGHALVPHRTISAGRGVLPYVTGTLGGLTGLLVPTMFEKDFFGMDSRLYVTSTLLGFGGGSWLGVQYHESIDYTYWQTVFIGASSATGIAMGLALPLISQAEDHRYYISCGIAGGWAGFFLGERLSQGLFERSSRDRSASRLRIDLPGIVSLPFILAAGEDVSSHVPALPVANLEWRF